MELLLIKQPYTISFAGNPVAFTLGVMPYGANEQTQSLQMIVRIEVEDDYNSGIFIEAKESAFYPGSDGTATIDIRSILKSFLTQYIPPLTQEIPLAILSSSDGGMVKRYRISYRLLKDNNLVDGTVATSAILYVIKGGFSYQEWHPKKYFTEVLVNSKPFLRFPAGKEYVFADEKKYLSWLYPYDDGLLQFIKYTIGLDDGTELAVTDSSGDTDVDIYKENVEWSHTSDVSAIDFDNATTPFAGSKNIDVPGFTNGQFIKFTGPSTHKIGRASCRERV